MRLPKASEIKSLIQSYDSTAEVYLFGSRIDDSAVGGDIDLLVLSQKIDLKAKLKILIQLYDLIGEQKVDISIAKDLSDPFHRLAFERGVSL